MGAISRIKRLYCHATGLELAAKSGGGCRVTHAAWPGPLGAPKWSSLPGNRPATVRQEGGRVTRLAGCLAGAPGPAKMALLPRNWPGVGRQEGGGVTRRMGCLAGPAGPSKKALLPRHAPGL